MRENIDSVCTMITRCCAAPASNRAGLMSGALVVAAERNSGWDRNRRDDWPSQQAWRRRGLGSSKKSSEQAGSAISSLLRGSPKGQRFAETNRTPAISDWLGRDIVRNQLCAGASKAVESAIRNI